MADNTPRLNLNRYDIGDQDWDHTDLVNFVDEHAITRGPVADRPSSGEYPDELFFATDESTLYRWDDTAGSWQTEIEAPPIDSVFGRVGQVVAEAGDYTASQIGNFSSAVIDAISGSDIDPSSVTTPSVDTDGLTKAENVTKIHASGAGQSISPGTVTTVQFDSNPFDELPGITVDLANNKLTIDAAGTYLVNFSVAYSGFGSASRVLGRVPVGGSAVQKDEDESSGPNPGRAGMAAVQISDAETPVDVMVETYQDSGSSQSIDDFEDVTNLEVVRLG